MVHTRSIWGQHSMPRPGVQAWGLRELVAMLCQQAQGFADNDLRFPATPVPTGISAAPARALARPSPGPCRPRLCFTGGTQRACFLASSCTGHTRAGDRP